MHPRRSLPAVFLLMCLIASGCSATAPTPTAVPLPTATATTPPQPVILTMASWRSEDTPQMTRIFAKFSERYPTITIKYDTGYSPDYDTPLLAQLKGGAGPDLFYLRSFDNSRKLYEQGFLESLDSIAGLEDNFSPASRAPWATDDGKPYGVPFIATSHGIYYNVDLFNKLGIKVPTTWEELIAAAKKTQEAGVIPFANASGSKWTMAEMVFMNLAPNFTGGRDGRLAYLSGQRCLNDKNMVAAFQGIKDLAPFLPPNQASLNNLDSIQLFVQGKAAMMLDGSWDIHLFEGQKPAFAWSVFAPPPPAGQPAHLTFHPDVGMGLNTASKHKAEARKFLAWVTTSEFAELLGNELPGFYPMQNTLPTLKNEHANTFLSLNKGRGTDARLVWDKLMTGNPSAYVLIQNGAIAVVKGEQTPQQAADALQAGVAQWYAPAQKCPRP